MDLERGQLLRAGAAVPLRPKSFDVLCQLLQHAGQLVTREQLLDTVWAGSVVTDASITQCLIDIRRALNDHDKTMVRTVPRRGFIFEVPAQEVHPAIPPTVYAASTTVQAGRPRWPLWSALLILAALLGGVLLGVYQPAATRPVPQQLAVLPRSIAVLPFTDMSRDQDQAYFAQGLAEEVLDQLAQIPGLQVIARTSSFAFQDQPQDLKLIARQLRVGHILEGSVRTFGERMRVTIQLIDTTDNVHLLSQTYDRDFGDTLALQSDIAVAVAGALQEQLLPAATQSAQAIDPDALRLYLQARHTFDYQWASLRLPELQAMLERALQLEPEYVAALNLLTEVYSQQTFFGMIPWEAGWQRVTAAAQQARALAPWDGIPLTLLANVMHTRDRNYLGASHLYAEAMALAPNDPEVQGAVGTFYYLIGNPIQSIELLEAALPRNPLCAGCHYRLFFAYLQVHDYQQAEAHIRQYQSLSLGGHFSLAELMVLTGRPEQAQTAIASVNDPPEDVAYMRALISHAQGDTQAFQQALGQLQTEWPLTGALRVAQLYAWTGENDAAFSWLARATAEGNAMLPLRLRSCLFDTLHGDPRWQEVLKSLGLGEQQLAALQPRHV